MSSINSFCGLVQWNGAASVQEGKIHHKSEAQVANFNYGYAILSQLSLDKIASIELVKFNIPLNT